MHNSLDEEDLRRRAAAHCRTRPEIQVSRETKSAPVQQLKKCRSRLHRHGHGTHLALPSVSQRGCVLTRRGRTTAHVPDPSRRWLLAQLVTGLAGA